MPVKLFLLGSPGSGKSTVARYIERHLANQGWSVEHINDYGILREMFKEDQRKGEGRFKPAYYEEFNARGFDVLKFEAFDEALQELEQRSEPYLSESEKFERTVILIEFARNDYHKAFHQFSPAFLQDAYFLYLDTDLEICKQRIRKRVAHPQTEDDYYVSDYIFQEYYNHHNGLFLMDILAEEYGIERKRIHIVLNNQVWNGEEEAPEVDAFIQSIVPAPVECPL
jgi:adenylate kinase family enzyme